MKKKEFVSVLFGKKIILILAVLLSAALACSLPGRDTESAPANDIPALGSLGPDVTIQQPQPGTNVKKGDSVLFSATASDDVGVTRIDLLVNGQTVLSQAGSDADGDTPLLLNYPLVATDVGTYALMVRAYDAQGLMGESPVYHINVIDAGSVSEKSLGEYVVKEGETLESIAQNADVSVVDIAGANPSVKNNPPAGRVIVVPLPKPKVAAAPPAQNNANQGNQGNAGVIIIPAGLQPVNLSEIQPVGLPVFEGDAPAGNGGLPGVIINPPPNNPNKTLAVPEQVKLALDGECNIKISWVDNVNKDVLHLIHIYEPGLGKTNRSLIPLKNDRSIEHSVSTSGTWGFSVAAVIFGGNGPNQIKSYSVSNPVYIYVPATENCKQTKTFSRVVFEPVELGAPGYTAGFIQPIIGDLGKSDPFRLPRGQGSSIPFGNFSSSKYTLYTWLPENKINRALNITVAASGMDNNNKPVSLGSFTSTHFDLDDRDAVYEGKGPGFVFRYKLYLTPVIWGANLSSGKGNDNLAVPTNFRLSTDADTHTLTWDYDGNKYDEVLSGFNIYREYYCPGSSTVIEWPFVRGKGRRDADFPIAQMPQGCSCSYQISASGQGGESARANLLNSGSCLTFEAEKSVQVSFLRGEVANTVLPRNVHIYQWVNYFRRSTENHAQKIYLNSTEIPFSISFGGNGGNTPISVGLGQNQSLQIGYYISDICQSSITIAEPAKGWEKINQDYQLKSQNGLCNVTVHIQNGGTLPPAPEPPQPKLPEDKFAKARRILLGGLNEHKDREFGWSGGGGIFSISDLGTDRLRIYESTFEYFESVNYGEEKQIAGGSYIIISHDEKNKIITLQPQNSDKYPGMLSTIEYRYGEKRMLFSIVGGTHGKRNFGKNSYSE